MNLIENQSHVARRAADTWDMFIYSEISEWVYSARLGSKAKKNVSC